MRYSRSIYSVRITVFENMQLCKLILYVNMQKEALGKCKILYISLHFFYEVETRNIISLVCYFFYCFFAFFLTSDTLVDMSVFFFVSFFSYENSLHTITIPTHSQWKIKIFVFLLFKIVKML